jgi:(p)ppGpp synthase/HD superfamily hydrolase
MKKNLMFLGREENRQTFFARIAELLYAPSDWRYKLIEKAYETAKDAFRYKYRETGERYFEHLRRTALILIDILFVYRQPDAYILICAALLHDIVEDIKSWTVERVAKEFGEEVAVLVDWLTKRDSESYHRRFENAPREFFLIKMSDRLDNLLTIWGCSAEKILRKIEETKRYYIPFAELHLILARELHDAVAQAKKFAQAKIRQEERKTR